MSIIPFTFLLSFSSIFPFPFILLFPSHFLFLFLISFPSLSTGLPQPPLPHIIHHNPHLDPSPLPFPPRRCSPSPAPPASPLSSLCRSRSSSRRRSLSPAPPLLLPTLLLSSDLRRPAPDRALATSAGRSGRSVEAGMWPSVHLLRPANNACHLRLCCAAVQLRRAGAFFLTWASGHFGNGMAGCQTKPGEATFFCLQRAFLPPESGIPRLVSGAIGEKLFCTLWHGFV
jgi:hypothetical protein